jgi:hypothetical protein
VEDHVHLLARFGHAITQGSHDVISVQSCGTSAADQSARCLHQVALQ